MGKLLEIILHSRFLISLGESQRINKEGKSQLIIITRHIVLLKQLIANILGFNWFI